jgi:hypothetical protein
VAETFDRAAAEQSMARIAEISQAIQNQVQSSTLDLAQKLSREDREVLANRLVHGRGFKAPGQASRKTEMHNKSRRSSDRPADHRKMSKPQKPNPPHKPRGPVAPATK